MSADRVQAINALARVGLGLARRAPSGRIVLARLAATIELEWIPRPAGEELFRVLAEIRDARPRPIPPRQVRQILSAAWGADPDEELDELDYDPVVLTPIAQVHRGALEGRSVAVKLLRPSVAGMVRQDLHLLESLLAPMGAAFPALDAGAVLAEARERGLDELDLEHEAGLQRRFNRLLRHHPHLHVPAPVMRLCHPDVLVSEWVEGRPLRQAPDPDAAAELLVRFALGAAREGLVHAGISLDDVIVTPDGGLAVLDFGAAATIDPGRVDLLLAALQALSAGDGPGLGSTLEELGALPASYGPRALKLSQRILGALAGEEPSRLDGQAIAALGDRLEDNAAELAEMLVAGRLSPEDLWPGMGAARLFATVARLGARGSWPKLAREALRDGLSA